MELNCNEIISKVNELVELRLNKGINPSELMENISCDDYIEVSARKLCNGVQCNVMFFDNSIFSDTKVKYKYVYIYNKEMFLGEIKLIKNKTESIVWSREAEERRILEQVIDLFNKNNMNDYHKTEFIKSLPVDLLDILTYRGSDSLIG